MVIIFLLMSFIIKADTSFEKYCFSNPSLAQKALKEVSFLKLPGDEVNLVDSCIQISVQESRQELFQKYILSQFPEAKLEFSSGFLNIHECELVVEKTTRLNQSSTELSIPSTSPFKSTLKNSGESEISFIKTSGIFELTHNLTQIEGKCRYINKDQYELTLKYKKIAPLIGKSHQEGVSFSTNILISRGHRTEILSLQKDPTNEEVNANLPQNLKIIKNNGQSDQKVYISIK